MKKEFLVFIKKLFLVSLPIIIQQLFLNIASLLDTLMVGQLDEKSISGVYIATQIVFVINLMIFGAVEGGSVFLCQFKGGENKNNLTKSFVFKSYFSTFIAILATLIVLIFNKQLVSCFSKDKEVIKIACDYIFIVSVSFIPYALTNSLSTSMRELDHLIPPTVITFIGILFNTLINYLLIYGKFSFPALGAKGAAIGTLVERIFEILALIILTIWKKYEFTYRLKNNLKIERKMFFTFLKKSLPLLINETLWSIGQTLLIYFFSEVDEIATIVLPISSTIYNLLFVVCLGLGNGISIIVGESIGGEKYNLGQKQGYYSLLFTFFVSLILGIILFSISPLIVSFYKGIGIEAKNIALILIKFNAIYIVLCAINNALFFLMRSGGRTEIVLAFDSLYAFVIQVPVCFLLLKFSNLSLVPFVCLIYSLDIIKLFLGGYIVISKKWVKNLTKQFK